MSVINDKAREVSAVLNPVSAAPDSPGAQAPGDHPFLDFLMELMQKLLPMLITCLPMAQRNATGVAKSLNSPNLRQRLGLKFHLRRNIDDPRTGNHTASEIEDALYKMGKGCNEADATEMMSEVA